MHPVSFRNAFERTSQATVVAVIPARYASSRFPGKPLADLAGRPMVEHVYRRAAEAPGVDAVVVATDDQRVADAVERFGGIARMTRSDHQTGMDRIAEVARDLTALIIVNVQGDEPLVQPSAITQMVDALHADPDLQMSTLRTPIRSDADYASPHVVKVVVDHRDNALYFSRAPIPYVRERPPEGGHYKHLGLYAYRRAFLLSLAALPQTALERAESLEQLRALEHGFRIRAVETQYDSIGVDTPEDLERVRSVEARAREGVAATRA
ncbi:MAG TPA: 3-deoxy-manno-octulosonate cytidylyltransferase [Vicinamibacterales bacterium]|nr:3-deoxy-manno-octulosonate cytidylyltransferase [Vicinamibacterales bacterium]